MTAATTQVLSADGTSIAYHSYGHGPDVVVVGGTTRSAQHYRAFAERLGGSYTVHVLDRRGRGDSGPRGSDYGIDTECDDVMAVLQKTQASMLFGHSYGGLIALEVALRHPVAKLAVFEPGVSVDGSFPLEWLPEFERALAAGRAAEAMAIVLKGGKGTGTVLDRLPVGLLTLLVKPGMGRPLARETVALMPTLAAELTEIGRLDSTTDRYRDITADTLILIGSRGTVYLHDAARVLASTIPRVRLVSLPKLNHSAPDVFAPQLVADRVGEFLAEPVRS